MKVNNGDFMCLPHVPTQSLGSLMTLNPEFTTVFLTTTGVMVLNFHFKQRRIDHGSSTTVIGIHLVNSFLFKLIMTK